MITYVVSVGACVAYGWWLIRERRLHRRRLWLQHVERSLQGARRFNSAMVAMTMAARDFDLAVRRFSAEMTTALPAANEAARKLVDMELRRRL